LAYPLQNCIECRDWRDRLGEADMAFERLAVSAAAGSAVCPAVDSAADSAGDSAVGSAPSSAAGSAVYSAVGIAADSAVGLRLDIDLSSGSCSDFEAIQTDFAGDNIARPDQDTLELLRIRLKIRFPRAYRLSIPPLNTALW